jgi:CRISPR associated protein Cas1
LQSLYLFPNNPARLKLDGPSLLLVTPGLASRRYPLRHVSHIVLGGAVQVEARTLAACLDRRIPLTFLSDTATLAGIALPSVPEILSAEQRIERFLSAPDWSTCYSDWLRASERAHLLLALKRAAWVPPPSNLLPHSVRQAWRSRLLRHGLTPDEVSRWIAFDHALLAARCASFLSRTGVNPSVLAAGPILAPADWISVLGWQTYADIEWLLSHFGRMLNDVRQNWQRRLTEFAERRAPDEDRRVSGLWSAFVGFVSRQIQESQIGDRAK